MIKSCYECNLDSAGNHEHDCSNSDANIKSVITVGEYFVGGDNCCGGRGKCSICGVNIPYLSNDKCNKCIETFGESKDEPKWFTTDKPLPDGKYWWRSDPSSDEEFAIIDVEDDSFWYYLLTDVKQGKHHLYRIKVDRDFSGEWLKIEFPE